jgi:sialic acid synthase
MLFKTKIICELSCNHQGDLDLAKELIAEAKRCGADFVKMQKRDIGSIPQEIMIRRYEGPHSFGHTYGEHRAALEFDRDQWFELAAFCREVGIGFFATPFDVPSAEFLVNDLGCEYIKMGSSQIHDPLMTHWFSNRIKSKIIMSTGMICFGEVVNLISKISPTVLMQTTSAYPCPETDVNLLVIKDFVGMAPEVGLSGHYVAGNGAIEAAAVALGATWIERHFTLDRSARGTDHAASLEPIGLTNVVKAVRAVERSLGDGRKKFEKCEMSTWEKIKK